MLRLAGRLVKFASVFGLLAGVAASVVASVKATKAAQQAATPSPSAAGADSWPEVPRRPEA